MAVFASFNLANLRTELLSDPLTLGYNAAGRNDTDIAQKINRKRASIQIARSDVLASEIIEAIDITELLASATVIQAAWFESFTQIPIGLRLLKDDLSNTRVISNLLQILKNASASENRIKALGQRNASRAEQLWGEGFTIDVLTIGQALS